MKAITVLLHYLMLSATITLRKYLKKEEAIEVSKEKSIAILESLKKNSQPGHFIHVQDGVYVKSKPAFFGAKETEAFLYGGYKNTPETKDKVDALKYQLRKISLPLGVTVNQLMIMRYGGEKKWYEQYGIEFLTLPK